MIAYQVSTLLKDMIILKINYFFLKYFFLFKNSCLIFKILNLFQIWKQVKLVFNLVSIFELHSNIFKILFIETIIKNNSNFNFTP